MGSIAFPSLIRAGLKSNPMLMLERERSHTVICEDHKEEVISLLFTWLFPACALGLIQLRNHLLQEAPGEGSCSHLCVSRHLRAPVECDRSFIVSGCPVSPQQQGNGTSSLNVRQKRRIRRTPGGTGLALPCVMRYAVKNQVVYMLNHQSEDSHTDP